MNFNFLAIAVAALIPLIFGFVWYSPTLLGKAWMKEAEVTQDKMQGGNMFVIFAITLVFSFFIAFVLQFSVIHETGVVGLTGGDVSSETFKAFMAEHSGHFRTFKHGTLHGFILSLLLIFPIITINALFERKSWKYIFINSGYWSLCLMVMGGILSAWV